MGRTGGHIYDFYHPTAQSALPAAQAADREHEQQRDEDNEEAEMWKCIVRMFVAAGMVEKTLREAGLPEFV